LSNAKAKDQIYLEEQATERTRSALKEIPATVAPSGVPGGNGCRERQNSVHSSKKTIKGLALRGRGKSIRQIAVEAGVSP